MRLILTAAIAFTAGVIDAAAETRCTARLHRGAVPWEVDYDTGASSPSDAAHRPVKAFKPEMEVSAVRRDARGSLWVERMYEGTWKRADVDLKGDCRRASVGT